MKTPKSNNNINIFYSLGLMYLKLLNINNNNQKELLERNNDTSFIIHKISY